MSAHRSTFDLFVIGGYYLATMGIGLAVKWFMPFYHRGKEVSDDRARRRGGGLRGDQGRRPARRPVPVVADRRRARQVQPVLDEPGSGPVERPQRPAALSRVPVHRHGALASQRSGPNSEEAES
jgi:hypothetical protein